MEAQILPPLRSGSTRKMRASAPLGSAALTVMLTACRLRGFPSKSPRKIQDCSAVTASDGAQNTSRIFPPESVPRTRLNPARAWQRVSVFGTGFGNWHHGGGGQSGNQGRADRCEPKYRRNRILSSYSCRKDATSRCTCWRLQSREQCGDDIDSLRRGALPPDPMPMLEAGTVGVAVVSRTRIRPRNETTDSIDDEAAVAFASAVDRPLLPLLLLPPPGTCTAYTKTLQDDAALPNSISSALALPDRWSRAGCRPATYRPRCRQNR